MNLICYLSNGYPTLEQSKIMADRYVQAGCDIIEIDFPSSDPFLENNLIANRMKMALTCCNDYSLYMEEMKDIKAKLFNTKFIILVYENTVQQIGVETFIQFCRQNDFFDVILVGIKNNDVKDRLISSKLKVSCYIQFHLPEDEVNFAVHSNGFVYLQAKPNDEKINPLYPTLKSCIAHLRQCGISRPIYCGVGIRTIEDVQGVRESGADGVFMGSTILKLHERIPEMIELIAELKKACQ